MNPIVLSPSSRFKAGEIRSPSRSPGRRNYLISHDLDPLLSNLSPTSTLEALEATDALVSEGGASQDALQDSIGAASTSERALGIRAALAGKKLKEWHRELTAWPWPSTLDGNGFRPPKQKEHGTNGSGYNNESYRNNNDSNLDSMGARNAHGEGYCGSIPARLIEQYEHRIEVIKDGMEALDLEALKEFVRDAHATANSRSKSRQLQGNGMTTGYNHLDDFTAVITATIMQALPTISHLTTLLSEWSIRLLVLRQVPGFLKLLDEVHFSMTGAWKYLSNAEVPNQNYDGSGITRATLLARRAALETEIFGLGRGLDNMLDVLEGREDTIPEEWIDDMESTEAEFGDWVVESEKKLIEGEWKFQERDELSKNEQIQLSKDETASNSTPEEIGVIFEKAGESARSPIRSPSSHSRSKSPVPTLSEHKINENHDILDPEENPDDLSTSISQSTTIPPAAFLNSTSCDEDKAPKLQYLVLQSTNGRVIHDSLGQNAGAERVVKTRDLFTTISLVAEDHLSLELANEKSRRAAHSHSQLNGHKEGTSNREISNSFIEPRLGCLEDQPNDQSNIFSKLMTKRSFENDKNDRNIETLDTDSSNLNIAVHSSAPESLSTPLLDHSKVKKAGTSRPAPLVLRQVHSNIESAASSEISSDTSYPGSGTSEYFSNMSSPEIQHASVAEYFDNPVEITTPSRVPSTPLATVSRQSSQRTERGEMGIFETGSPQRPILSINHRRRASTFGPLSKTLEGTGSVNESPSDRDYLKSHLRVRSASLRSFEIIPRHEVRNITISRKGSYSSTIPEPIASEQVQEGENAQSRDILHPSQESPIEPLKDRPQPLFQDGDKGDPIEPKYDSEDESRNMAQITTPRPSSRVSDKSRSNFTPRSTPVKLRQKTTMNMSSDKINRRKNVAQPLIFSPSKSSEDQLEARISSILTEIPGHIQLRSGPEPDAREVLPLGTISDRKKSNVLSPALKMMRARTSLPPPPLTLAPAHPTMSRSRTQFGEPEVKLYHLHQVGKDVPVKLFVRLVGEGGERVMVRIGGGWADLGEYLKEYASHHGRRSVSDGRFDIQGLPQSQSTTPVSALAGISSPAASPASRPNSSSGGPGLMAAQRRSRHSTNSSADFDGPMTPDNPIYRQLDNTPGSIESNVSLFGPSSRLSLTDDDSPLGLAGPTTRRKDVSPSKQAWVDGMVDQARKASVEKKKGQDGDFGDLGKVGTTKRVFMKSRRDVSQGS